MIKYHRRAVIKQLALLLPLLWAAGCAAHRPPPPALESVTLLDVQGFSGGTNLWFSRNGSSIVEQATPRLSGAGLESVRYDARLAPERFAQLERLIDRADLMHFRSSNRPLVPDEARPEIFMIARGGVHACAAKRADDENPRFDSVYTLLKEIIAESTRQPPIETGNYDWLWRPPGFPSPAEMIKCAQ